MGWLYVEIERLSSHKLLFAAHFYSFVYTCIIGVRVLCMRGDFGHLGERATLKLMLHVAHYLMASTILRMIKIKQFPLACVIFFSRECY